jgi:hypothetical protein
MEWQWQWLWIPATFFILSKERREEILKEIRDDLHEFKADILEELKNF